MTARPTLAKACAQYVHRFTMEHVPAWALKPLEPGKYYAPQYLSDAEWYANTTFPGEIGHFNGKHHCHSTQQTWPKGLFLSAPFKR